jgi:hypothetical protein
VGSQVVDLPAAITVTLRRADEMVTRSPRGAAPVRSAHPSRPKWRDAVAFAIVLVCAPCRSTWAAPRSGPASGGGGVGGGFRRGKAVGHVAATENISSK